MLLLAFYWYSPAEPRNFQTSPQYSSCQPLESFYFHLHGLGNPQVSPLNSSCLRFLVSDGVLLVQMVGVHTLHSIDDMVDSMNWDFHNLPNRSWVGFSSFDLHSMERFHTHGIHHNSCTSNHNPLNSS